MPIPKVRIITNAVSDGARALGEKLAELGVDVSRVRASSVKTPRRLNIKWGCFAMNNMDFGGPILNGNSCDNSLNKLLCFQVLRAAGVPVPDFTTGREVADGWLRDGCRRVYERHSLRGSEGDGIVVVEADAEGTIIGDALGTAPLYVKGMHGIRREYRIHVFHKNGVQRVFIQQKRRRNGVPEDERTSGAIRNLANGWIFAHNDVVIPRQQTIDAAVGAIKALNLNFGGVDLIEMDDITKGSVVLEINCAPGLQGGTLDFYAQAILGVVNGVVDTPPTVQQPEDEEDEDDIDVDF